MLSQLVSSIVHDFFSYYTSGGGFNPAVSFAAAICSGYWDDHYVYWAGPIVGCLLAALVYR